MKQYIHTQVEELCTHYGKIDYFFFDGVWPRCADDLGSHELVKKMREWQPGILINNRLGFVTDPKQLLAHGGGRKTVSGSPIRSAHGAGGAITAASTGGAARNIWTACVPASARAAICF